MDNLNTDSLNISIYSGEVVLKNLKLKKEALDKFRLPVDVIEGQSGLLNLCAHPYACLSSLPLWLYLLSLPGHLGSLRMTIPYTSLGRSPVSVVIEDVYLLTTPSGESKVSPTLVDSEREEQKEER